VRISVFGGTVTDTRPARPDSSSEDRSSRAAAAVTVSVDRTSWASVSRLISGARAALSPVSGVVCVTRIDVRAVYSRGATAR
jgi:hypothetical protein